MAAIAQRDQEKRTVEVNRLELIKTLESNREQHVKDYDAAMAGYKELLLSNIDKAFEEAKVGILVDVITIEMKVPRSFAKEYDAAIDMAKWDVRETLELTHAEFTCFVRDQWDWKSVFEAFSTQYIGKR